MHESKREDSEAMRKCGQRQVVRRVAGGRCVGRVSRTSDNGPGSRAHQQSTALYSSLTRSLLFLRFSSHAC